MSALDHRQLLTEVFYRLRENGFMLGIGELLAALDAADGQFLTLLRAIDQDQSLDTEDYLREIAELLWCHSREDVRILDEIWTLTLAEAPAEDIISPDPKSPGQTTPEPSPDRVDDPPLPEPSMTPDTPSPEWTALPVHAPYQPALPADAMDLRTYWPVSRRLMAYAWRYLRRPIPDGPADILDIRATVERVARQGFFLAPVYRRRERNNAHLMLLIDQTGSMTPFHRFTRDLVDTAQHESSIALVEVYYFHNIPTASLYRDPFITEALALGQALAQCSSDSSILIVSDAGAARGYRSMERVRATSTFLARLKQRTTLIGWLNPMPQERWAGTSAQLISYLVPMFQMDPDGLSNAVDVVRGQPLHHYQ